jgi:hypothetical protein
VDLPFMPRGSAQAALMNTVGALTAYDVWGQDPARAAGLVTGNVVLAVLGPKGVGAGLRGGGAAAARSGLPVVARAGEGLARVGEVIGRLPSVSEVVGRVLDRFRGLEVPRVDLPGADVPPARADAPGVEPRGAGVDGPTVGDAVAREGDAPAGTGDGPDGPDGPGDGGGGAPDTGAPAPDGPTADVPDAEARDGDVGGGGVTRESARAFVDDIPANPGSVAGRSAQDIADQFNAAGYPATVERSQKAGTSGNAVQVRITGHPEVANIQVHPGGGRHTPPGSPYWKISTSTRGRIWVVPENFRGVDELRGNVVRYER